MSSLDIVVSPEADIEKNKEVIKLQAQLTVANTLPRNEKKIINDLNPILANELNAERAFYSIPYNNKGKTEYITGPTIRFAELIAQNWPHLSTETGVDYQNRECAKVYALIYDSQKNNHHRETAIVRFERTTKKGSYIVNDLGQQQMMIGAKQSKLLRNCILRVIPSHIVEYMKNEFKETLNKMSKKRQYIERVLTRLDSFSVTQEMIEKKYNCKIEEMTKEMFMDLSSVSNALKEGQSEPKDFFNIHKNKADLSSIPENIPEKTKNIPQKFQEEINQIHDLIQNDISFKDLDKGYLMDELEMAIDTGDESILRKALDKLSLIHQVSSDRDLIKLSNKKISELHKSSIDYLSSLLEGS